MSVSELMAFLQGVETTWYHCFYSLVRYRGSLAHLLPDYGCLILSPANIWGRDPTTYQVL